jgi:Ca2+-transporting ATPase
VGESVSPKSGPPHPYRQTIEAVIAALDTESDRGLADDDARVRLARDGPNELIAESPAPVWKKLLAQLQNVLVVLLFVATAISAGLWLHEGDTTLPYEAIAIGVVVLLNAGIGFVQDARAHPQWPRCARCPQHTRGWSATASPGVCSPRTSWWATS